MEKEMPEGVKWPQFKAGGTVGIGALFTDRDGIEREVASIKFYRDRFCISALDGTMHYYDYGEPVGPAPVIAADGKPLEVGQKVWGVEDGKEFEVVNVNGELPLLKYGETAYTATEPEHLTHQRPVLDVDGVPIKKGDEVYLTDEAWVLSEVPSVKGEPLVVTHFKYNRERPVCAIDQFDIENGITVPWCLKPGWVTHTKPKPDSWSSVWADVSNGCETPQGMERRCKALAKRGER